MTEIVDVERQIRWEMGCNEAGTRRYLRTLQREVVRRDGSVAQEAIAVADSRPGSILIAQAVAASSESVAAAAEEAKRGIADGGAGRQPEWWWTLGVVDPDKAAFITVRCIFTMPVTRINDGRPGTSTSSWTTSMAQI